MATLLTAYALNLDPSNPLAGMPRAIVNPTTLGIEFYASASGIAYEAQTSTDLVNWTTVGVTLSELDPEGCRTATVDRDGPRRFMRLVVAEN